MFIYACFTLQFIRYVDYTVEEDQYHLHTGDWAGPECSLICLLPLLFQLDAMVTIHC